MYSLAVGAAVSQVLDLQVLSRASVTSSVVFPQGSPVPPGVNNSYVPKQMPFSHGHTLSRFLFSLYIFLSLFSFLYNSSCLLLFISTPCLFSFLFFELFVTGGLMESLFSPHGQAAHALSPGCKGDWNWFCFEYSDVCLFVPARKIIYLTKERSSGGALIFISFGWAVMEKWGKYKGCVGSDVISNKQDWFWESELWFMLAF